VPQEHITSKDTPTRWLRAGKMMMADAVKTAFRDAVAGEGKLSDLILGMEGMSGRKYRYFINNLIAKLQNPRYLEIGSCAGSTLCSAIYKNAVFAVAVDNWSQFGGPMAEFFANLARSCSLETKVSVINSDFRQVDFNALGRFNVYLFDGPHSYADHYDGLAMAFESMENEFVYIVDDWNWEEVRGGTLTAISDLCLTVVSSTEVRTSLDNSYPRTACRHSDWHNGYFISILRK
jgi:hypothetical protein